MTNTWRDIEELCHEAVHCRICFEPGSKRRSPPTADIEMAQPRWVGPRYFDTKPRVLVLLENPASGEGYDPELIECSRAAILRFRDGATNLRALLSVQSESMHLWGRPPGRFCSFYGVKLSLARDETAFANAAWCAVGGNKPPKWMLRQCFGRYTANLLQHLKPDVVVLSGSRVHFLKESIEAAGVPAICAPHYAHRMSEAWERERLDHVNRELSKLREGRRRTPVTQRTHELALRRR